MTRPTTEQLQETLKELVTQHNEAVTVQNTCKEQIIGIRAILQDRELEDGDTNNTNSEPTED